MRTRTDTKATGVHVKLIEVPNRTPGKPRTGTRRARQTDATAIRWRLRAVVNITGQPRAEHWRWLAPHEAASDVSRERARQQFHADLVAKHDAVTAETFRDLCEQFFNSLEVAALAEGSRATLRRHIDHDVTPVLGPLAPGAITVQHCAQVLERARTSGYAINSLRRIRFAMSKVMTWAETSGTHERQSGAPAAAHRQAARRRCVQEPSRRSSMPTRCAAPRAPCGISCCSCSPPPGCGGASCAGCNGPTLISRSG